MISGTQAIPLNYPKCYQVRQWPVTVYLAMAINKVIRADSQNYRHRSELGLLLEVGSLCGMALGQLQEGLTHLWPRHCSK